MQTENDSGPGRTELAKDNADLARQLSDASARRADAYDEGYERAMQDAHYVLNQRGYLERRGDDNGNPYRPAPEDCPHPARAANP